MSFYMPKGTPEYSVQLPEYSVQLPEYSEGRNRPAFSLDSTFFFILHPSPSFIDWN